MAATRDQKRGEAVHRCAIAVKGDKNKELSDGWGRWAHKLPILIRQAGLAQALAFAEAKGKAGGERLLDDLAQALGDRVQLDAPSREALLKASRTWELAKYQLLTREVLATLVWCKRFAQSVLDVDATSEGKNS